MEITDAGDDVPQRPLTAEEKAAGSADPRAQSEAIMEDSARRTASRDAAPGTHVEHRTSDEATPPVDPVPASDVDASGDAEVAGAPVTDPGGLGQAPSR
jgi:hypothetical protein